MLVAAWAAHTASIATAAAWDTSTCSRVPDCLDGCGVGFVLFGESYGVVGNGWDGQTFGGSNGGEQCGWQRYGRAPTAVWPPNASAIITPPVVLCTGILCVVVSVGPH